MDTNRSTPAEADSRKRTRPVERGQGIFDTQRQTTRKTLWGFEEEGRLRNRIKPVEREFGKARANRPKQTRERGPGQANGAKKCLREVNRSEDTVGFEKEKNLRNRSKPVEREWGSGQNRSKPAEADSRQRTRPVERGRDMFETQM